MDTTQKPWQKGPLGCLAFAGFLLIFLILIGTGISKIASNNPSPDQTSTPSAQVATDTASPEPTKPLTMTDRLWSALDTSMKSRKDYEIEYNEDIKMASIIKTSTDPWDESSLVRGGFTTLVKFGTEAFKIENVDAVQVVIKTKFTDQYGKDGLDDGVRIIMSKTEFAKFDWKNLEYQSVYNQIKNASEAFYIHPAVLKNIDYSKLYLTL